MTRSELREVAVKVLYGVYINEKAKVSYDINELIKEQLEIENEFVKELVNGVLENQKEISTLANKYLIDWTIDRLNVVEKAILSIGIYELMYTQTPNIVCINEAVELAKKFGEDNSPKMINACLDKLYHSEDYHE